MGKEIALKLEDDAYARDDLWRDSKEGQEDPHHGPFEVDIDIEEIEAFFA